jgi:hypothetical protein
MYRWLSEHSFEIALVAGLLGKMVIIGFAMLDFV